MKWELFWWGFVLENLHRVWPSWGGGGNHGPGCHRIGHLCRVLTAGVGVGGGGKGDRDQWQRIGGTGSWTRVLAWDVYARSVCVFHNRNLTQTSGCFRPEENNTSAASLSPSSSFSARRRYTWLKHKNEWVLSIHYKFQQHIEVILAQEFIA